MSKKYHWLVAILLLTVLLNGCSKEPLKFRNLLEADKYYHSNIEGMEWSVFEKGLSKNAQVSKDDFQSFKKLIKGDPESFHVVLDNEMYRFSLDKELLYQTIWKKEHGTYKLKDIYIYEN
ncbi:hypothetical protein [Metabacillus indicus]|uniref:hypothetical protein n=1 Tax=Metabacillus indicus TaxID=246786 RepID=UPI00049309D4|nr:hypothetical protein [Metabacillus indicus]KEZ48769.1 hypothetical protein AZ46_0217915 [Metabacillus indicus LMG 22858]